MFMPITYLRISYLPKPSKVSLWNTQAPKRKLFTREHTRDVPKSTLVMYHTTQESPKGSKFQLHYLFTLWLNRVRWWRDRTARSSISHGLVLKQSPNLPIWWKLFELRGIMVNKGQIHREIRKFLMFSSKLIKLDDKSMVEIRKNSILWKIIQIDSTESRIIKIDLDFAENLKIEVGGNFRTKKSRIQKKSNEIKP